MLAAAAVYDIAVGSIPNRYIVWSMVNVIFFKMICAADAMDNGVNLYMLAVTQIADCIKGVVVAFICGFVLYVTGAVGAGDAKLYMVMGMIVEKAVLMKMGVAALCMAGTYGLVRCVYEYVKQRHVKNIRGMAVSDVIGIYETAVHDDMAGTHLHRIALAPWMFAGALLIYTDMVFKGGM